MLRFLTSSIARRLYGLLFLFALGFTAVVIYQLNTLGNNLNSFKRTELQSVVQSASSIVARFAARAEAGEMTLAEAQAQAIDVLRAMRYQGDEYLFIDSFEYVNVMHSLQPEKEGTDRKGATDGNGKLYLAEMIDAAKATGSHYENYLWKSPDGAFFDKITYAQAFKPWGWVIASGVLLTTVQDIFLEAALTSAAITLGIMVLLMGLGFVIVRSISRPVAKLTGAMTSIADGDYSIDLSSMMRRDEIGGMVKAVEVFRANGLRIATMTDAEKAGAEQRRIERDRMMAQLQQGFGEVVDAAVRGDFSKRVDTRFADAELNTLANGVNELVTTVDRGLSETGSVLAVLANADLTRRVEGNFEGAFAQLRDNTNAVAQKLGDIVARLRDTSRSLKLATTEILSGANDLSERTTKQAATVEQTSAAIEQLATTITDNSRKAEDASHNADGVTRTAEEGGKVMQRANEAMDSITQSSAKISNIIGMIDDIAFQTNLLALNASVEAARAGDAGAGFAVVAVEVRRLAQSSAQASSQIKVLIEQSAVEVGNGSKLVADAADKLATMLAAVRENNVVLGEMARANRAQATSIDEVNTAVRQMDEMTQHNAALVEEINASIEQTEAQATDLDAIVEIFAVSDTGARRETPAPTVQPKAAPSGIRALQAKVKTAARSYLGKGNTAVAEEWSEF